MANRRPQHQQNRRNDYGGRNSGQSFGRPGVSPWQGGGGPNPGLGNLPLLGSGNSTEATLALANNLISNLLQTRQNNVPSLLDMPIRRDFGPAPDIGRFDHGGSGYGHGPNPRMGNQGNFRRTGNFNRPNDRMNTNQNNRNTFRANDGYRQPNRNAPRKDAASKARPSKESDPAQAKAAETKPQADGEAKDAKEGTNRYDGISQSLLKCHICNTSMWDGRSFENHINGMAHSIMMQKTAEGYALTADTMRQEFKIRAQIRRAQYRERMALARHVKKEFESQSEGQSSQLLFGNNAQPNYQIREMKRTRKAREPQPRDFYCAMCDLFAADGAAHRTAPGHRKLKKYLHPACAVCHKEMPTRIELDEHRLSAEHMRRLPEDKDKDGSELLTVYTMASEMIHVRGEKGRKSKLEVKQEPGVEGQETAEQPKSQELKLPSQDTEKTIVDFKQDEEMGTITEDMLPIYSPARGVGASFMRPFEVVECTLCARLLAGADTAAVHARTRRHHTLYVRALRTKGQLQPETKKRALSVNEDDQSDQKRRRNNEDGAEGQEIKEESQEVNEGQEENEEGQGEYEEGQGENEEGQGENEEEHDGEEDWLAGNEEDEVELGEGHVPEPESVANGNEEAPETVEEPAVQEPEPAPEPEVVPEPEPVPEPVKTPAKTPAKTPVAMRGSPRGRGRGRGRARGRY